MNRVILYQFYLILQDAENVSPAALLSSHLTQWRQIRNTWKTSAQIADMRYNQSYNILKTMFDKYVNI